MTSTNSHDTINDMQRVILINKPVGATPLQCIHEFKKNSPEYQRAVIGYAGRLDPMAEGLLLLLIGNENKKRKEYEAMAKTYEFSLLFGIETDTYDLMGLITQIQFEAVDKAIISLPDVLPTFLGKHSLPYPPFSSRTVAGKPLYWYARNAQLSSITIPQKDITIFAFVALPSPLLLKTDLLEHISQIVPHVKGDFRQSEIVKKWYAKAPHFPSKFPLLSYRISCSSGTYIRGIVHELGKKLSVPAVTYSIKRTAIGDFSLDQAVKIYPVALGQDPR